MKNAKKNPAAKKYKYDVALSFAGEDRIHAESLFHKLKQRGFTVFYDADRQAHIWGKRSDVFERVYGPQSRYVIPFLSKYYVQKDWTRYEFETAKREEGRRRGEFILPVRLDDSRLIGLHDEVIRLDARKISIEQIAQLFAKKCRPIARRSLPNKRPRVAKEPLCLLQHDARSALGLIATAAVRLPATYFKQLFPKYDWDRLLATFRREGITADNAVVVTLNESAIQAFRSDVGEREKLNQAWIDRLSPLQNHIDMAAFLSMHLITLRRTEDAARVAVSIVHNATLGGWTPVYLTLLKALVRPGVFAKLTHKTQLELLNGLGVCLSESGQYGAANTQFAKLRKLSKKYGNAWGVGQSLLNAGVAAHRVGKDEIAERLYLTAETHAKRSRDMILRGRALSNLSQLCLKTDIARSERLLDESVKIKTSAKDSRGLVVALCLRANLAVQRGDFPLAARQYQESARAAARTNLHYEYTLSTYNHACALQDGGKANAAKPLYEKARKIANTYGYMDILQLSLNALGARSFEAAEYAKAHGLASDLLTVAEKTEDQNYRLSALHMLAMSSLANGQMSKSRQEFRTVIDAARTQNDDEWSARCLIDSSRLVTKKGIANPDRMQLQRLATVEAAARRHRVAAALWRMIAHLRASSADHQSVSDAYRTADRMFAAARNSVDARIELHHDWFAWAWTSRRFDEAATALKDMENLAKKNGRNREAIAAVDQRGFCMQELRRYEEAAPLHRHAASAAKVLGDDQQEENSLNNLGEALRQLNRNEEAIRVLGESERIAQQGKRYGSALSISHNRALALEALGKYEMSVKVLKLCRAESARQRLWPEYVRSWEGLANLAWARGRPAAAMLLYRRAAREAKIRKVHELEPRIALNFSRLLRIQNRARQGLVQFRKFRPQFDQFIDAYNYYGSLAELYVDCKMPGDAAEAWKTAGARARAAGNVEYGSYCASKEAHACLEFGKPRLSRLALRGALEVEQDAARRTSLLIQLLEVVLTQEREHHTQELFDEAMRLCTEHHLLNEKKDLHLVLGDHDIKGPYRKQLNAFKAYSVALMSAMESGLENCGETISHIVFKIASVKSSVKDSEVSRLIEDLRGFLEAQMPEAKDVVRYVLWPFYVAEQLVPLRRHPRRFVEAVRILTSDKNVEQYLGENVDPVVAAAKA